tara:strand:+ start:135 stop:1502 length:1368 start_codon:yes stop_codon:yes gene_type:complete
MAKKELIDNIIKLYSKLGGNMNNVLGSRSNITFLGTGKNPEPFVEMSLNMESVAALGKSKVLQELESPMGYLTANKLNDIQAGKLYENMLQLDEFYNPKAASANITDLASGTGNLTPGGLEYLRLTGRAGKKVGEDLPPKGDPAKFRPNENLPSLAELRKTQGKINIDEIDEIIKETDDIIRPKGDYMTDEGVMASETILPMRRGNQGAMPIKRANAREFLVEALKKDTLDPATSGFGKTNLNDVVSAEDVKLITEGGGGIGGDPLLLVEKYFGPRIVELIPDERITPRFINRLLTNVRDNAGRAPDDPRFDRFTATLINEDIPFAEGGRAGFRLGGITNSLLKKLNTKKIKAAVDNIFETGDYKYDAELAAESLVEMNPQLFGGKLYDDLDDMIKLDVYDLVLKEVSQRNALKIQARRGKAAAAKELKQKSVLSEYKPKKFDAANGGLAKILEV